MTSRLHIKALADRVAYYEWAYGRLAESDVEIGPVGEFLVGRLLDCLPPARKATSLYDLEMADGTSLEVKTTTRRHPRKTAAPVYRWDVGTQLSCLNGTRPLARYWIFLICAFPESAAGKRHFDVFDLRYWQAAVLPGTALRTFKIRRYVTEPMLKRIFTRFTPVAELPERLRSLRALAARGCDGLNLAIARTDGK